MWSHPFDSNFSTPGSFTSSAPRSVQETWTSSIEGSDNSRNQGGRASHGKRDERAVPWLLQNDSKCIKMHQNASMREHFEVWRSSGTTLVRFFLGFLTRLFRLHSEHGIKGVFWLICDDLWWSVCHRLSLLAILKGCYVGLLRRPIRGHPHLQLSWCRIVATASWTASTSRRFSWFQSISHISMGYAEHWLCWKCYSVQGPCHRAQSLPGWSWQVRFASLQAKSSSTYGTAGQKIIENHGTSWKIQIARPAQQCWKMLKVSQPCKAILQKTEGVWEAMAVKRAGVVPDDGMRTLVWQGGYRRDRGRLDFTKKASLSEIYSVIAMWVTY